MEQRRAAEYQIAGDEVGDGFLVGLEAELPGTDAHRRQQSV